MDVFPVLKKNRNYILFQYLSVRKDNIMRLKKNANWFVCGIILLLFLMQCCNSETKNIPKTVTIIAGNDTTVVKCDRYFESYLTIKFYRDNKIIYELALSGTYTKKVVFHHKEVTANKKVWR